MRFTRKTRLLSALESTAMTDIIFLLMVFFLLSSSFILQTGVKVDLPQVELTEPQSQKDVVITLTSENDLYMDEVKIAWTQLRDRLAERLSRSESKAVIVKGDAAVSLGRTVEVMDIARQLGAAQLAIAAEPLRDGARR